MSTKAELQALLERVKAATGPDREIDIDLCLAIHDYSDDAYARYCHKAPVGSSTPSAREFLSALLTYSYATGSLDAITALVERELPGWWCELRLGTIPSHLPRRRVILWNSDRSTRESINGCVGDAATPALALTAAFLSAMIAQLEVEHAE